MKKICLIALFSSLALVAFSEPETKKMTELKESLAKVSAEIAQINVTLTAMDRKNTTVKREATYTNSTVKAVYSRIVALERQLMVERKKYEELLAEVPEVKSVSDERLATYAKRRNLIERKQLIVNEIKAEQYRNSSDK